MPIVPDRLVSCLLLGVERQEYVGKAGDVLDDVFFVVKGRVEARLSKPGKQVGGYIASSVWLYRAISIVVLSLPDEFGKTQIGQN